MTQVTAKEAEKGLARLIAAARQGEEVLIMEEDHPVARIVSVNSNRPMQARSRAGTGKGVFRIAPDFDAPREDFKETMV